MLYGNFLLSLLGTAGGPAVDVLPGVGGALPPAGGALPSGRGDRGAQGALLGAAPNPAPV